MKLRPGVLVSYRSARALIVEVGSKVTIRTASGDSKRVREKDVMPIHPGPVSSLSTVGSAIDGEIETAWEMLEGSECSLEELCELAFGEFTPETAWSGWCEVQDGIYFDGEPKAIRPRPSDAVEASIAGREKRRRLEERKNELFERIRAGRIEDEDRPLIGDVESLARGLADGSTTMRELGMREEPERAHDLLLRLGVWDIRENPYPARFGVPRSSPEYDVASPADDSRTDDSNRVDLTHLDAYAIDDAGTTAADDAVSIEDGSLWVHIADPAAQIGANEFGDTEAKARGATYHGPFYTAHMLSEDAVRRFSLGMSERCPALSLRLKISEAGDIALDEVVSSWVRVTRMTYQEADSELWEGVKLTAIADACDRSYRKRSLYAAPSIDLPEARIIITEAGEISFRPVYSGPSRALVLESMLMVGYVIARYAIEHGIPMPFSVQNEPDIDEVPATLAEMWAARRKYRRSEHTTVPGAHAGLGLPCYVQSTSPLRRYLDLLTHQQLRAALYGGPMRSRDEVSEAIAESDYQSGEVRRAEHASNRHLTLAYLLEHPEWTGDAVVVALGKNPTVIVPELALEAELMARESFDLDETVPVSVDRIRQANLECYLIPS